jgi:periplasmic copper chaperone A
MRSRTSLAVGIAAALAFPAAAGAHVTVQPSEAPAGGFTVLDVRVPTERDDASTTKVQVQWPDGFGEVSYQPVPGWKVDIAKEKLDKPIKTDDGDVSEQVKEITFTADSKADGIAPGQFRDFPLSVGLPDDKPGSKLTFKALQTYSDGQVVRWIGSEQDEHPAPQVTLTDANDGATTPVAAQPTPAAGAGSSKSSSDDGGGSSDTLAVIALIVGALGLVAGGLGLASARRAAAT